MAGEWIKMETSTPDKPEVFAIAARMGWDDPDLVVGKLFRVWRWFDQHTEKGNAPSVTPALLDRISGVTGFAEAMQSVGWLHVTKGGVDLPNFDRHCGKTAKDRALTAKRVANHKSNGKGNAPGNGEGNATGNAGSVSRALPREEKRRKKNPPNPLPGEIGIVLPDWLKPDDWERFVAFRVSTKHPMTPDGMRLAVKALDDLRADGHDPGRVIDQSILNSWRGLFAIGHQRKTAGTAGAQREREDDDAMMGAT